MTDVGILLRVQARLQQFAEMARGLAWPDLIVAAVLATLGLTGGWQIIGRARGELREVHGHSLHAAE